jgi:drug/metabolite transporter (DMT)-like permease
VNHREPLVQNGCEAIDAVPRDASGASADVDVAPQRYSDSAPPHAKRYSPGAAPHPTDAAGRARAARLGAGLPPGLLLGFLGVLGFSFSLPATRLAVHDLDPWVVAFGRAVVAGLLAVVVLRLTRARRPTARQWRSLGVVALGVVVGFPLLTSLALHHVPASHGAVVVGLLPALTAVFAVLRGGERPSRAFWGASGFGLAAVVGFALTQGGGTLSAPDAELLAAVVLCALGYAEGGRLARDLGGANTICWALVAALPFTTTIAAIATAQSGLHAGATSWLGFAYVTLISMFLGFFAWYAGLARGGVAKIGQVQLSQPVLTLTWSALILGEHITTGTAAAALVVLAAVVATQRTRVT